jgi:glycosyltransferase involved in cell wall biosynthesis
MAPPSEPRIDVIIPARDEEAALPLVLRALPRPPLRRVVVVDNASRDRTAEAARGAGAEVAAEARLGYGAACLRGLAHLGSAPPDIVVFMDADGSDDPADLPRLLAPLLEGRADLSLGSRLLGTAEPGSLTSAQRLCGWFTGVCLGLLFGRRTTDLGPLRAARFAPLCALGMRDRTWGWTVEMQGRAARAGWRIVEVPVHYRRRAAGRSKISGSLLGSVRAAARILWILARLAVERAGGAGQTLTRHPDRGSS